jgi:hypothetical protein
MADRNAGTDRNRNRQDLQPEFRELFELVFKQLAAMAYRPVFLEGFRSTERQAYLYAQGRTRPGNIVTGRDGVKRRSEHQPRVEGGGGCAADIAFEHHEGHVCSCKGAALRGKLCWDGSAMCYRRLGALAEDVGCAWGGRFGVKGNARRESPLTTAKVGWDPGHIEGP